MRKLSWFKKFALLFQFISIPCHAQFRAIPLQLLDTSNYSAGTFFSVIFDKNREGHVWAMPSEGATYYDGKIVEQENVVPRTRGHKILRNIVQELFPTFKNSIDWAGGGFKLNADHIIVFSYISRSINGGDGELSENLKTKLRTTVYENLGVEILDQRHTHGVFEKDASDFFAWIERARRKGQVEKVNVCREAMNQI